MNDYLCPWEMEFPKWYKLSKWVRQNLTDTIPNINENKWENNMTSNTFDDGKQQYFILPKAHLKNPFRRQDW